MFVWFLSDVHVDSDWRWLNSINSLRSGDAFSQLFNLSWDSIFMHFIEVSHWPISDELLLRIHSKRYTWKHNWRISVSYYIMSKSASYYYLMYSLKNSKSHLSSIDAFRQLLRFAIYWLIMFIKVTWVYIKI